MFVCYKDPARNNKKFLVADPSLSCELSAIRILVYVHAGVICVLVGAGFPIFIVLKIKTLVRENR